MKIQEVIDAVKAKSLKKWRGKTICEDTTRDKILYGDPSQQCTGIVSTLFASIDVIKQAAEKGANFIICHEALFWNHGDYQDFIADIDTYQKKKELLDYHHICVWRNHDYIHAGIDINGTYRDGIFYGLAEILGWNLYSVHNKNVPMMFEIPKTTVKELAQYLMEKMHVKGIRCAGNLDCEVSRVLIPMHIIGEFDNLILRQIFEGKFECIIAMEITDFTISEYIRDSAMLNQNKCILNIGHFNVEEPGMKFFGEWLKNELKNEIPVEFIPSGDAYQYIMQK